MEKRMAGIVKRAWIFVLIFMAGLVLTLTLKPELKGDGSLFDHKTLIGIAIIMFISMSCEYVDATIGMGYGTTLTPLMLIAGFNPLDIVPAVLFSQFIAGLFASVLHQKHGNVDFKMGGLPLKVATVLSLCSIVGTVVAVIIAVNISPMWLKTYIGVLIVAMGVLIIVNRNRQLPFSWRRITLIGLLAAFNKGMSGGGYGPLVMSGQVLSGVNEKNAVGVTALAEGITCAVGVALFALTSKSGMNWSLTIPLALGSLISVPISTWTVKIIPENTIKTSIGYFSCFIGAITLVKILL